MDILKVKQNGVWTSIPALIGPRGTGIVSITKTGTSGLTDTYTITFSDNSTTTFQLQNGAVPNLTIGTVAEGATAAATITGTTEAPVLNLVLPNANVPTNVSELQNDAGYLTQHQDISGKADKTDTVLLTTLSRDRKANTTVGTGSIAWGVTPTASGTYSTAVGGATAASGTYSTAIGQGTQASAANAVAEGAYTVANGSNSHAEGMNTIANHRAQHALGEWNEADGSEANYDARGNYIVIVGNGAQNARSNAYTLDWNGNAWHAGKVSAGTVASPATPTAANELTTKFYVDNAISTLNTMALHICTAGEYNSETGVPTIQNPDTSTFYLVPGGESNNLYIEWVYVSNAWERFGSADVDLSGYALNEDIPVESGSGVGSIKGKDYTWSNLLISNRASNVGAFAIGLDTNASNIVAVAEGSQTVAAGFASHAVGNRTSALSDYSFTAGMGTIAIGNGAHAEGLTNNSNYLYLTSTADSTIYSYRGSLVPYQGLCIEFNNEPLRTNAIAYVTMVDTANSRITLSKTLGEMTDKRVDMETHGAAIGQFSHVEGRSTIAYGNYQHVQGKFNSVDISGIYADIVGNGSAYSTRSNAYALTWTGDAHYAGDVYVGCNADSSGGTKLATTNIVAISDTQPTAADNRIWIRETAATSVQVPTVTEMETALAGKVGDVQVAGTSVVTNGVAAIPVANNTTAGVIKTKHANVQDALNYGGTYLNANNVLIALGAGLDSVFRMGGDQGALVSAAQQHKSVFYGLAKAAGIVGSLAGDTVGTYTSAAKTAIKNMIGVQEGLEVVRLI